MTCPHGASDRRTVDGDAVCPVCWTAEFLARSFPAPVDGDAVEWSHWKEAR